MQYNYINSKGRLSDEDFENYFIQYKNGDKKSKEVIVEYYLKFILKQIKSFENMKYEFDDLFSISMIGFFKALDTYDISKNIKFSTYAGTCMNNEILKYHRKERKNKLVDSLDRPINNECEELRIIDTIYDDFDFTTIFENKILYKELRNIVATLPDKKKQIIKLYFGFYDRIYTQNEISNIMNVSQSYISREIMKILKYIKKELENKNLINYKSKIIKK